MAKRPKPTLIQLVETELREARAEYDFVLRKGGRADRSYFETPKQVWDALAGICIDGGEFEAMGTGREADLRRVGRHISALEMLLDGLKRDQEKAGGS